MKIFLVGGAVRDKALHLHVKERDWVVVGGTPDALLKQGFQQVGREFPVFLHPKTKEEYALARKERKAGSGYHGFICEFSPEVSLEEDLLRRDLTINAMAEDETGRLFDPYQGMQDLHDKILRHVSPAFIEDPVRVLRVARFAARYHHLGFKLAEETRQLMYQMVKAKELNHLVAERVWQEWQRALTEDNPTVFFNILRICGALKTILPEFDALFGVPGLNTRDQGTADVGRLALMHLEQAAIKSPAAVIRFAALSAELGKNLTHASDWPCHPQAQEYGMIVVDELCQRLRIPKEYRDLAYLTIKLHQSICQIIKRYGLSRASEIVDVLEQADAFRRPERFSDLLVVCESIHSQQALAAQWLHFLEICQQIAVDDISGRYQGAEIKMILRERRINNLEKLFKS